MDHEQRAELAQALGMKPREIVAAQQVPGGLAVTTFDGQTVHLSEYGDLIQPPDPEPEPLPVVDEGVAPPEDPEQAEGLDVPDGSAKTILAWVGGSPALAVAAIDAERARQQPRSTLIAELEKVASR